MAQDTDILVLLCYHRPSYMKNLYLLAGQKGSYNIESISICERKEFLFKYSWSGCDTVSKIHNHTKKKEVYHRSFPSEIVEPFFEKGASCESIRAAGIRAIKITYGITNTIEKEQQSRFFQ